MAVLTSPFTSGAAATLPDIKVGSGKLLIRVENTGTDTDMVYFSTNGRAASATNAQGYLFAGEAIEICGSGLPGGSAAGVSITAGSGTPKIFWGII